MVSLGHFRESPAVARSIWASALRSGRYERCRTFLCLHTPTGDIRYSSFGVACEEFRKRYPTQSKVREVILAAAGYQCAEYGDGGTEKRERFYLPEAVRRWLGLADSAGSLQPHYSHLGYENFCELDDSNVDFDKLADLIDAGVLVTIDDEPHSLRTTRVTLPRG
jgi:hypothetical protein